MKTHLHQKAAKSIFLFNIIMIFLFSQTLWAAPKTTQSNAKAGDCAACHDKTKVLPEKHVDTKKMNWETCKTCHTKDKHNLAGKLPGSHFHQLSEVSCIDCHGKTATPEALIMEQCVACHGSTSKLAEKTKDVHPTNPHTSPHYGTELDCNLCHRQHTKSEIYCTQCHKKFNFKVK